MIYDPITDSYFTEEETKIMFEKEKLKKKSYSEESIILFYVLGYLSCVLALGIVVYLELPDGRTVTALGRVLEFFSVLYMFAFWWKYGRGGKGF